MGISPLEFQAMLARTEAGKGKLRPPMIHTSKAVEEEGELSDQVWDLCRQRGLGLIMPRTDKRSTITEGAHDATIFAEGGRVFCFELKDREGKLSTKQQGWIAQMRHNGHTVHVVRSIQEILDIMYQPQLPQSAT